MAGVDRNNPKRAASSESKYSLMEFMREFPDDATCLDFLWRTRFSPDGEHAHCPKCDTERTFKRYENTIRRQVWNCTACGYCLYPTAGTIYHKSSTSLHLWFYAIYLMSSTRGGVSAKALERELGVTYKTAWRMMNLIRTHVMTQDDEPLAGDVEMDETYVGGRPRLKDRPRYPDGRIKKGRSGKPKVTVFGAVERGGRIRAEVVPDKTGGIAPRVHRFVLPASSIFTDEWVGYKPFDHSPIARP